MLLDFLTYVIPAILRSKISTAGIHKDGGIAADITGSRSFKRASHANGMTLLGGIAWPKSKLPSSA